MWRSKQHQACHNVFYSVTNYQSQICDQVKGNLENEEQEVYNSTKCKDGYLQDIKTTLGTMSRRYVQI